MENIPTKLIGQGQDYPDNQNRDGENKTKQKNYLTVIPMKTM